jgi:hypothetical protein
MASVAMAGGADVVRAATVDTPMSDPWNGGLLDSASRTGVTEVFISSGDADRCMTSP